ncbi:hypothetical protein ACIQWA_03620 [Kitasatospora sp. NPDC098652]|uniref:hypothetical protein n=1 Tax=Kitasatospora sp. NPDC098652 TaxID=3364095 RepID=UPI0038130285
MDSGIRAMVDAVDEARRQLRENALPKARDNGRDKVPAAEEAQLLGSLAALVDAAGELAAAMTARINTPDTRKTYRLAGKRLCDEAGHLRGDQRDAAKRVE